MQYSSLGLLLWEFFFYLSGKPTHQRIERMTVLAESVALRCSVAFRLRYCPMQFQKPKGSPAIKLGCPLEYYFRIS
jgi:hypothetical protein